MLHWRRFWKLLTCRETSPTNIVVVDNHHVLTSIGIPHPEDAIKHIQENVTLFLYDTINGSQIKHVPYVKIVIHKFNGIAYTVSKGGGKEIHINANHIRHKGSLEALGILAHELTHVWQNDGKKTLPSFLIEGIADLVRLELGYIPDHWSNHVTSRTKWDEGYHTTAYFLKFVNTKYPGSIKAFNKNLANNRYNQRWFEEHTGNNLESLWNMYLMTL